MILLGTIVNTIAIIIGALIGSLIPQIRDQIKTTVMQAIGLSVVVLGIMMVFKTDHFLLVIFSLVIGSIIGEWMQLEERLNKWGQWLETKVGNKGKGNISTAFVTSTLVYCIGAMAILGALDSGLRNNHDVLYTKAMLDGFTAIIFTSTLGIGVIFSSIPVFLYQGAIAISATIIVKFVNQQILDVMINEITAVGGVLIIAIAFNLLEIKKMRVANMLPALFFAAAAVPLVQWMQNIWNQVVAPYFS